MTPCTASPSLLHEQIGEDWNEFLRSACSSFSHTFSGTCNVIAQLDLLD